MSRDEKYERYLETRAESLGLPTDPEAYQDGGLAEIAATTTVSGADTLVALLRANGVPAWVKTPLSVLAAAPAVSVVSVLVPAGRLADAQRLIAEKGGPYEVPAEGELEEEPEDEAEPEAPARMGTGRKFAIVASVCLAIPFLIGLICVVYVLLKALLGW
jgi:hypothetical protein